MDFEAREGDAAEIYSEGPVASSSSALSKRLVAALLALFVGALGIHKFYLGLNQQGVIMLVVFVLGWILLGLPSLVVAVVAFIEAIIYFTKSDEEFEQTYIINKKAWF